MSRSERGLSEDRLLDDSQPVTPWPSSSAVRRAEEPGSFATARLVPGGAPDLANSLWVPVLAVLEETPDLRTFRLARPKGLDFLAGQAMKISIVVGGRAYASRCSISSAPESAAWVEVSVKRRGASSRALFQAVDAGSLVSVQPPEGSFVYPARDTRPVVLIGGGSGCVPLMSMLRHAAVADPSREVTFLASVRTAKDLPFRRDLRLLARNARIHVGICLTREGHRPGYLLGRIDEEVVRRAAPLPSSSLFLVAGPAPMVEATTHLLARLGVPREQIRTESFGQEDDPSFAVAGAAGLPGPVGSFGPAFRDDPGDRRVAATGRVEEIEERLDAVLAPWSVPDRPSGETEAPAAESGSGAADAAEDDEPDELSRSGRILRFPTRAKEIPRFRRGERMLHWSIAVPFMTCFATGMILKFFYGLHPEGISRDVLAFVHRVSGGALAVFPTLAVLRNWRDYRAHLENVKVGWTWTLDDVRWLLLMVPAAISKRFTLPDQRKFNAAERLNFMAVMVTYPVFVATGLVLWMPGIHFVPWVVHFGVAVAVAPLMGGHIHMALVNPSTRVGLSGMITGLVDREWASHHYARWYRENFEEDGRPRS